MGRIESTRLHHALSNKTAERRSHRSYGSHGSTTTKLQPAVSPSTPHHHAPVQVQVQVDTYIVTKDVSVPGILPAPDEESQKCAKEYQRVKEAKPLPIVLHDFFKRCWPTGLGFPGGEEERPQP